MQKWQVRHWMHGCLRPAGGEFTTNGEYTLLGEALAHAKSLWENDSWWYEEGRYIAVQVVKGSKVALFREGESVGMQEGEELVLVERKKR